MSAFDSQSYYRFQNAAILNATLQSGISQNTQGAINMTKFALSSSENWQIYVSSMVHITVGDMS